MASASLSAIIAAAGSGSRFGGLEQLSEKVGGKSVLCHSIDVFEADDDCSEIIVVVSPAARQWIEGDPLTFARGKLEVVDGGDSRGESVANGVRAATGEVLAIHDGNRPNFDGGLLGILKASVRPGRGVAPALPAIDAAAYLTTIGETQTGNGESAAVGDVFGGDRADHRLGHLMEHVAGEELYLLQTPQLFYRDSYLKALAAVEDPADYDDDSALYIAGGFEVAVVAGRRGNIKVVAAEDLRLLLKLMGGGARKKKDKYGGLGW
jgi:2-C-methyl-D-erythritol 4-phosphate cytidylyltransferase